VKTVGRCSNSSFPDVPYAGKGLGTASPNGLRTITETLQQACGTGSSTNGTFTLTVPSVLDNGQKTSSGLYQFKDPIPIAANLTANMSYPNAQGSLALIVLATSSGNLCPHNTGSNASGFQGSIEKKVAVSCQELDPQVASFNSGSEI